jgi:hypothetical protein
MTAILFSEMAPDAAWEDDFNAWYDTDHIPVRMVLPGFEGAQRYRATEGDNYLVVYDMDSLDALKTPGYEQVKTAPTEQTNWMLANVHNFTRYLGTEIARHGLAQPSDLEAPMVFATMFNVPAEHLPAFDAWISEDHIPMLMKNPDWLGVRRFALSVADPVPFNRLAIHYLADPAAMASPERAAARATEWRARMAAEHDWFQHPKVASFTRHGPRYLAVAEATA